MGNVFFVVVCFSGGFYS